MTDKLNWFDEPRGYAIAWEYDDGAGMYLGESPGDNEHEVATAAARQVGDPHSEHGGRLLWNELADVKKALRAANEAIKIHRAGAKIPDWAIKARAEGWKPPKGWLPKHDDDIGSKAKK